MNNYRRPSAGVRADETTLERLRKIAELRPAGASITVTREALLEALDGATDVSTPPDDITVAELATRFQRSPSTIRGWLEGGLFPGAYKLRGREWRVPAAAIDTFRDLERGQSSRPSVDLGGWRKHQRPD